MKTPIKLTSLFAVIFTVTVLLSPVSAVAVTQTPESVSAEVTPIDDEINLQVVTIPMHIPKENTLPWGAVKGTVADPVEGYPVIIQIFEADDYNELDIDDLIHVAQVDVENDDSYEYKFRVLNVDHQTGETENIFEGNYIVKVFKVVHNDIQTI